MELYVFVAGLPQCGKSCLLHRLKENSFPAVEGGVSGVRVKVKDVVVAFDECELDIREVQSSFYHMYMGRAQLGLFCFDASNADTYYAMLGYVTEMAHLCEKESWKPIVIVALRSGEKKKKDDDDDSSDVGDAVDLEKVVHDVKAVWKEGLILGSFKVSSQSGQGIAELTEKLYELYHQELKQEMRQPATKMRTLTSMVRCNMM